MDTEDLEHTQQPTAPGGKRPSPTGTGRVLGITLLALALGAVMGWFGRGGFDAWVRPTLVGLAPGVGLPGEAVYQNARFGYQIIYPKRLLFPQGEADNGDGQTFLSKNSEVRLAAYGSYNALDETLETAFRDAARGGLADAPTRVVTDKRLGDNWFSVSGFEEGYVFYSKRVLIGDRFVGFDMRYPEDQRAIWDPIVREMSAEFIPERMNAPKT